MREVKHHVVAPTSGRLLPGVILVAFLLLCAGYVVATSSIFSAARRNDQEALADLEKQIADGCAGAETWMTYGELLQERCDYGFAADAYRKVLETAPFERNAQMELAVCLALTGRDAELKVLLQDLAVNDAKLAVEIMSRQELGSYMAGSDFAQIMEEARDQAND